MEKYEIQIRKAFTFQDKYAQMATKNLYEIKEMIIQRKNKFLDASEKKRANNKRQMKKKKKKNPQNNLPQLVYVGIHVRYATNYFII